MTAHLKPISWCRTEHIGVRISPLSGNTGGNHPENSGSLAGMSNKAVEFNDWLGWIEQPEGKTKSNAKAWTSTHIRASAARPPEETVQPSEPASTQPQPEPVSVAAATPSVPVYDRAARARWLQQHDVRTEMLDGGIGCCWFAQQGEDEEPVCGQTEEEAIARLVREKGLPWIAA